MISRRFHILLIISLFGFISATAQNKSNKGKEFWLGYGYNSWFFVPDGTLPPNSQELNLYLTTEAAATVTVSIPGSGWTQTLTIPANTVDASILVPKTGTDDARMLTEGLGNRAVHIVSDTPIVVFAHMYNTQTSGATMLIPVETYGYKYYSLNYSQSQSNSKVPYSYSNSTANGNLWYSWFYVVASEDNTRLEITTSDTTRGGVLPGQTFTVNLNRGQTYCVMGKLVDGGNNLWQASKDLTGSKVVSVPGNDGNCHPFALFSGSGGIRLCYADGGEVMMQQAFPVQAWGSRYLTYHMLNNTNTDINDPFKNFYRIAVDDPTTVVRRNGTPMTGLVNNFYYEIIDSTGGDYITADKPIMVAQYTPGGNRCWNTSSIAYGDPEMIYLSPVEQGSKDALFYANRKTFIDFNYLNVMVQTTGIPSLRLDGAPFDPANIITHPNNPAYSVAVARIFGPAGQHRLTSDSIFNATIYGLGYFESYGYNVGTFVNNLNSYLQIQNTLNNNGRTDTFTCPRTPVRLFVKLAFPATSITWKFSQVPGINPNVDSISISPALIRTEQINGRTYYVYTLQQDFTFNAPGLYKIPVSYTSTVIENCNQTEFADLFVNVKPGPPADFSISNQLCLADTVRFTGTTSTVNGLFNYNRYLWSFDDASTQNTRDARKRFASTGSHPVAYRVIADNGCIGDTTKTINIINGTGPQLSLNISGNRCKDSLLTFTSSIVPDPNNPTSWFWDFGGGQTISSNQSHITTRSFSTAATNLTIRHSATLTNGCQPDTITVTIPVIHNNPVADFSMQADTLCPGKPVNYSSTLSPAAIRNWRWNFSDGTGSSAPPFVRPFTTGGSKTVQLIITDTSGCGSAPVTNTIIINPAPVVSAGQDKIISLGNSTTLDASIINPANYTFSWSPSVYLDQPSLLNPVSTPAQPTIYTITATDKVSFCEGTDAVLVNPVSKLYIPTAFTPNRDGRNDTWGIPGLALYPEAVVSIYNRWGQKIFETKNYTSNPWNGLNNGQLEPGVYIYMIRISPDKPEVLKGTVTVLR
ncbi:MAG: gliding motility-associated C-terminal domain-containing protein [Chitinophagaceae bacterium]|nr:gliding motility-associated C-terminal domain-containing protein [Chitinophagaceae bacterium]MBP6590747.1 gliding motility-associated C-terminal domain-containing protein [Chitinophagaceae bacterium]MBP8242965.1 gliding motility-associated C-terminal domain-containing protein [Chitinophagaceae bacterium]